MVERTQIAESIKKVASMAYRKDVSEITEETVLTELNARSILLSGFVSLVQEKYNIPLRIPEVSACGNVGKIIDLITKKVNKKQEEN